MRCLRSLAVVVLIAGCAGQPPGDASTSAAPSGSAPPPPSATAAPSPSQSLLPASTLARVTAPAAVLDKPGGRQWATLEPAHFVLVVDVLPAETDWYRVEFEYCCAAGAPYEWVFGWVAGNLETAGLAEPGFGIDPPEVVAGPTLEPIAWSCPSRSEGLHRIPEPVRHTCYEPGQLITIRGVLGGGFRGEALYPGDPAHLTALPNADLMPTNMEGGRFLPLHVPNDPLLMAWFNDERVRLGEEVAITGAFGRGAVECTKSPRLEELPAMSREEQELWCAQQFTVSEIHGEGPDPVIEAPLAEPLWVPPLDTQPTSGDGWRLLASSTRNQLAITVGTETVDYATDPENYRRLWLSQARGELPAVDFEREFVVQLVPPVSGTCPWIAFTGVGVAADENILYGIFTNLPADLFIEVVPGHFGCTTDATPHAFLVAVERSRAPAESFRLRLREERLCVECGITWDETTVRLDG